MSLPILSELNGVDLVELRDTVLTAPVYDGTFGDYPWDRWEVAARQVGIDGELACLGRDTMREAFQHDWDEDTQVEMGWLDGGALMICQALGFPEACAVRWAWLLSTDNGRVLGGSGGRQGAEPPMVARHPMTLAQALEDRGIKTDITRISRR